MIAEKIHEDAIVEELKSYKGLAGRVKVLERYPIGNGMMLDTCGEDKLQALHKKLKGLPSYMYLNGHEQELENLAAAYLTKYPLGIKSQLHEVRSIHAVNDEEDKKLGTLQRKIKKVIEARRGDAEGFKGVVERLSEMQGLQDRLDRIDHILDVLDDYKPHYARLLKLRYVEDKTVEAVSIEMSISRKTFDRWRQKAVEEYANLSMTQR
jgi:uncharacterized protein YnzC (UPF0291/DUF896 family)